jgi:adenylosuccinate lyase
LSREDSYAIVQKAAHLAWNKPDGDFRKLIGEDETVRSTLTDEELEACFDPKKHLKNLDQIYQRLGI